MNDYDRVIALAARVSETLERAGIEAVLSVGAAVQIYSRARYVSKDLDFVTSASHRDLKRVLGPVEVSYESAPSVVLRQDEA